MDSLTTIYCKTPSGQNEIDQRSSLITARQRSLLIMIDGKKTVAELAQVIDPAQLEALLTALLTHKLIEVLPEPEIQPQTTEYPDVFILPDM